MFYMDSEDNNSRKDEDQNGAHLWGDSMYAILVAGVGFEPTTFWL